MTRLVMSAEKYNYLVENIDFLDFILVEQIRDKGEERFDVNAFASFLTTSIYTKDGEIDIDLSNKHEIMKKELEILKQNFNGFETDESTDKITHFLNHLMGSLDLQYEENARMIPILLEYVEYHKSLQEEDKKVR